MNCSFQKYTLNFKQPGGTSRGVLKQKETYFILAKEGNKIAYGECNRFKGLSSDDRPDYEEKLKEIVERIPLEKENVLADLAEWPSIYFGVEMLLKDWEHGGKRILFPEVIKEDGFHIPTNGLIWMGEKESMKKQIQQKLKEGFVSIKLKIGAIDFQSECDLMQYIRSQYSADEVEIRLDANGAFSKEEALEKLKVLEKYCINYIEQPIRAGQWEEMAFLAAQSPIPIALDEELIGIYSLSEKQRLIDVIQPQLLILKPALIGGFHGTDTWRSLIERQGGSWVITSALESNIGLNAIAQYTAQGHTRYAQGLGTGQLYTNNFSSPYTVDATGLHYHLDKAWDLSLLRSEESKS